MLEVYSILRTIDVKMCEHIPDPSLLGLETPGTGWQDRAFEHLAEKCAYLIHVRGYAAWTP